MFPKIRCRFLSSVFFFVISFSARNSEYVFTFLTVRWRLLVRLPSPNKNKLELFLLLALALHVAEVHLVAAAAGEKRARAQEEPLLQQKSFDLNAVEVVVHQ